MSPIEFDECRDPYAAQARLHQHSETKPVTQPLPIKHMDQKRGHSWLIKRPDQISEPTIGNVIRIRGKQATLEDVSCLRLEKPETNRSRIGSAEARRAFGRDCRCSPSALQTAPDPNFTKLNAN